MASADHPPAPAPAPATGIQPAADTLPASAPVPAPAARPPARPPESPERFARRCRVLDGLLVALVLLFAFLVASFAVYNSDFFRQLATGRLLAEGKYTFGADPFTWGSGDAYWVNHSWLFALLVYGIYRIPEIGGAAVVVCKALLVTALAEVLMRVGRRHGRPLWIPAACTALAVLALSPRLILTPTCVSYLFVGLTLWLLRHPRQVRERQAPSPPTPLPQGGEGSNLSPLSPLGGRGVGGEGGAGYRSFWLLPPLFGLWVNLDSYFLLGPLVVALYLGGETLRLLLPGEPGASATGVPDAPTRGELRTLAIALVAGVAACLVNPFGVRAFALPEGLVLSEGAEAARQASGGTPFFSSPLQGDYLLEAHRGSSVAGWAYVLVLILSLASFVLAALGKNGPRAIVGWRLFLWLPLALLSLASVRCIGFFAVAAGPVTALNLLDFAPSGALTLAGRRWALGGRAATLLLVLAAVLATVPGWLHAQPHALYRLAWAVRPDPSLRQMAEQVRSWREQNRVPPETRWLNLSPEAAPYLAWFAPGERALLDYRYSLFGAVGDDFRKVREELGKDDPGPVEQTAEAGKPAPWRRFLREGRVRFVVVPMLEPRSLVIAHRLLSNPAEWVPCYLDGRMAVFGWRDPDQRPGGRNPFADLRLDFTRLAFGPQAEKAPSSPGRAPEVRPWWTEWWTPPPPADLDIDAVRTHYNRFLILGPSFHDRFRREWEALEWAGLAGLAAGAGGPALNGSLVSLRRCWTYHTHRIGPGEPTVRPIGAPLLDRWAYMLREDHSRMQDAGPPESLYLAVRAARRSLAVNPDEPRTHLLLGQAYDSLWRWTREGVTGANLWQLAAIRRTQVAAALNNALKLGVPPATALQIHELLFILYSGMHPQRRRPYWEKPYVDLCAKHRRAQLQLLSAAGSLPGYSDRDLQQGMDQLKREVEELERRVKDLRNHYEVDAVRKPLREQVRIALEHGLAEDAVKVIQSADPADVLDPQRGGGPDVLAKLLDLLLDLGQLDEARAVFDPLEEKAKSGSLAENLWFLRVRLAAAAGDYAAADHYLAEAEVRNARALDPRRPAVAAQIIGAALLNEAVRVGGAAWLPPPDNRVLPHQYCWPLAFERSLTWSFAHLQVAEELAEWHLVRGWLALEAGSIEQAREQLDRAARPVLPPDLRPTRLLPELIDLTARGHATRALAERYRAWLDAAGPASGGVSPLFLNATAPGWTPPARRAGGVSPLFRRKQGADAPRSPVRAPTNAALAGCLKVGTPRTKAAGEA
jgi:tetratricopeptide (TPR) repeat protein